MIAADLGRMLIVFCMLFVRSKEMVWMVYPLLVAETLLAAFFEPARSSVIPNIVEREDVVVANTLSSTTWSLNLALGSALGGAVAVLFGRDSVFVINAATFAISAVLIGRMRFHEPHVEGHPPMRAKDLVDFSPIVAGIRYVRSDARRVAMLLVKSGLGVIGPGWVLFTVMGKQYFPVRLHGLSAERSAILGMSVLLGARGVGALIGPLISATWAGRSERRLRIGVLCGYLAAAAGYTMLGLSKTLLLACACTILAHMGGAVAWVFSTTLLQLTTEDRFRGRVFAAELGFAMITLAGGAYLAADPAHPAYDRIESSLLKAFSHMPQMEIPEKKDRLFELRCYESPSESAGQKKIEMFNDAGEIDIFKKIGARPVFFGETIIGLRRPNLTYMLCFDNMEGHDARWKAFGSDPEWKKISAIPEYSDAKLISKITRTFLSPTSY